MMDNQRNRIAKRHGNTYSGDCVEGEGCQIVNDTLPKEEIPHTQLFTSPHEAKNVNNGQGEIETQSCKRNISARHRKTS